MDEYRAVMIRTLENKILLAENNQQQFLWVPIEILKDIVDLLREEPGFERSPVQ